MVRGFFLAGLAASLAASQPLDKAYEEARGPARAFSRGEFAEELVSSAGSMLDAPLGPFSCRPRGKTPQSVECFAATVFAYDDDDRHSFAYPLAALTPDREKARAFLRRLQAYHNGTGRQPTSLSLVWRLRAVDGHVLSSKDQPAERVFVVERADFSNGLKKTAFDFLDVAQVRRVEASK